MKSKMAISLQHFPHFLFCLFLGYYKLLIYYVSNRKEKGKWDFHPKFVLPSGAITPPPFDFDLT